MPESLSGVYLGFDFGFRRIGVAIGQTITLTARPLLTLGAREGVPEWLRVAEILREWHPRALIVGLPTHIDDSEQYTTPAAREFARELHERFSLPVHLVDERLTTVEARAQVFAEGGYRKLKKTKIDSIAACVILEQWLQHPEW